MREAYIYDVIRTAIGKKGGLWKDTHPTDLGAKVVNHLFKNNLEFMPDDVMFGCVTQINDQGWNIARNVSLAAGLDISVPGTTINRLCASSLQAINFAADSIKSGTNNLVIAGGVESMTRVPMGSDSGTFPESLTDRFEFVGQGVSAELIALKYKLSREEVDKFSYMSHIKAARATNDGLFAKELLSDADQGIRSDISLEKMSKLKPAFETNGVITAASSSQISDGAAAVLIGNCDKLQPRARIVAHVAVGVDPIMMLTGPIPATKMVVNKAGLSIGDIGLFECNEAFAPVVMAWMKECNIPEDKVNVNGGAIALGHPLGCSGARLITTLLNAMEHRKVRYGLATMCIGMGQGVATIIERI